MPAQLGLALGSLLFSVGAPLAVVNFFAIGAGGSLIFGLGLTILANTLLRPGGGGVQSVKPSDGQQSIRQAVPPRMKSYGRVRLAGIVWWFEAELLNGVLSYGLALNHGRISAFVEHFIDDNIVTIDINGTITSAPYTTLASKGIFTRLGLPVESQYDGIETDFGVSNVRGDGVATKLVRLDNFVTADEQFENFPNGLPRIKTTIDASVVWNFRNTAQLREDPTTWGWSENPVDCLLNFLLDDDGYAVPWARIEPNLAQWIAAANVCDEQVLSLAAGGNEKRYRLAITYLLTDRPADIVARILSSCDGKFWQKRDGSIGIAVGVFSQPTVTIGDRDITSYELTRGQDRLTAIAGVRAQYMSPDHDYLEQDAEAWPDGDTVMALGEDRVGSLDLTMVPSHSQARRLMKRTAVRSAAPWKGSLQTNLAGIRALDERYINVVISELGISQSFEVGKFTLDLPNMRCQIEVSAAGAEIDDWDSASEEGTAPTIPAGLVFVAKDTDFFGNFDDNSFEERIVDGSYHNVAASLAQHTGLTAYFGLHHATPKAFGKAMFYSSSNAGFIFGSGGASQWNANVTITCRGKNTTQPVNGDDGTLIGTVGPFADVSGAEDIREMLSTDTATAYDYWVFKFTQDSGDSNAQIGVDEIDAWEFV